MFGPKVGFHFVLLCICLGLVSSELNFCTYESDCTGEFQYCNIESGVCSCSADTYEWFGICKEYTKCNEDVDCDHFSKFCDLTSLKCRCKGAEANMHGKCGNGMDGFHWIFLYGIFVPITFTIFLVISTLCSRRRAKFLPTHINVINADPYEYRKQYAHNNDSSDEYLIEKSPYKLIS